MKSIENAPLYTFVRFVLTGFVALFLFGLIPVAILNTKQILSVGSLSNAIVLFLAALTIGFILDGMKLYQMSFGYKKRRQIFMKKIAETLDIDQEDAPVYFVKVAQLERDSGSGEVALVHARWILIDSSSKMFFLAGLLWAISSIVNIWFSIFPNLLTSFIVAIIHLLIAARLHQTSNQERRRADNLYIHFCKVHRNSILPENNEDRNS